MIQGFHVELDSKELVEHFRKRAAHHAARADWYKAQADQFEDAAEQAGKSSNSPRNGLKESAKDHAQKASYFAFCAEHLALGETYRLNNHELSQLELVTGTHY